MHSSVRLRHRNERRHKQIPKAAKPLVVQERVKGEPDRKGSPYYFCLLLLIQK